MSLVFRLADQFAGHVMTLRKKEEGAKTPSVTAPFRWEYGGYILLRPPLRSRERDNWQERNPGVGDPPEDSPGGWGSPRRLPTPGYVTYITETGYDISETVNTISETGNIKYIPETVIFRKPLKHRKQRKFTGTHFLSLRAIWHGYYTRIEN